MSALSKLKEQLWFFFSTHCLIMPYILKNCDPMFGSDIIMALCLFHIMRLCPFYNFKTVSGALVISAKIQHSLFLCFISSIKVLSSKDCLHHIEH